MRSLALTLVAVLAACSSEPTEEELAAAVAEAAVNITLAMGEAAGAPLSSRLDISLPHLR